MKREKSIYKTTNMILISFVSNVNTRSGSQSVYLHECVCQVLVQVSGIQYKTVKIDTTFVFCKLPISTQLFAHSNCK